jgi:hypothetical protein
VIVRKESIRVFGDADKLVKSYTGEGGGMVLHAAWRQASKTVARNRKSIK